MASRRAWLFAVAALLASLLAGACGKRAAVATGGAAAWRFAVVCDTQGNPRDGTVVNEAVARTIAEDIVRERVDFVLMGGDLVNGWFRNGGVSFPEQYAIWKRAMAPLLQGGVRIFPVRGNHDHGPERTVLPPLPAQHEPAPGDLERLEKAYREAVTGGLPGNGPAGAKGLTYGFVHKNALVVALDEYAGGEHRVPQAWLDAQLARADGRHVFAYGHEPAFETIHKDNLAAFPEARDRFWDSLGAAGARVYFCGHDHIYNRAAVADRQGREIRQVIAGTGGGALKSWPGSYPDPRVRGEGHSERHHGYLLVTVDGPRATVEWRAIVDPGGPGGEVSWQVPDSFSYDLRAPQAAAQAVAE
jgi:hypothetical protein